MVQLFSVQGPRHEHFADRVIGGDNLKGSSDVARGQRENHLSGGEMRGEEAGLCFLLVMGWLGGSMGAPSEGADPGYFI